MNVEDDVRRQGHRQREHKDAGVDVSIKLIDEVLLVPERVSNIQEKQRQYDKGMYARPEVYRENKASKDRQHHDCKGKSRLICGGDG